MAVKVIDASALAAILFGEPEAADVVERLGTSRLVAPALLPFEVASVCLKKIQRHPELRERLLQAYALGEDAGIDEVEVTLGEVITLADESGLTCYDASYLWLAIQLNVELVTLDEKLAGAAERFFPRS
jgi:predicted nucleic acid-binding protein